MTSIFVPLALLLGMTAGITTAQAAYPCSGSTAGLILRSADGTCADSLVLGQEFDFTYKIANVSIVDDPGGPADGTLVTAVVSAGQTLLDTLAQDAPDPGSVELPGVLTFIPVCPVGSTGGALAPGDPCDPLDDQCGTRECGCVSSPVGVGCHRTADPNKVHLAVTQNIPFAAGQMRTLAAIRVKVTGLVPHPAPCGLFYTRLDSDSDFLMTNDPLCETQVSAGAQASVNMEAPECQVDEDCGDPQCNVCVDVGTNNHCEPRAASTACGVDAEPGDCLLPGCVINAEDVGICTQGVVDAPQDTACTLEAGQPVPAVECQTPQCNATGNCVNVADAAQNGNACGTDEEPTDCTTPACVDGTCTQSVLDMQSGATCSTNDGVAVPSLECQTPECDAAGTCVNVADATQNGEACGTDADLNDCTTPACLAGACEQGQIDLPAGGACSTNSGVPVPAAECQTPQCNASGTCENVADASQNGDACGTDQDLTDCTTPACLAGACAQGQIDLPAGGACSTNSGVPVPAAECQTPQCNASGTCTNTADASQNGDACGTDQELTDCTTPACVNGACNQGVIDLPAGQACSTNDDVPVPAVLCLAPQCDASGTCVNAPDPAQNGAGCGTDEVLDDCKTPACLDGACAQLQNNVAENTACAPDDNICTDDVCDANGVCQHIGVGGLPCDDLFFCTGPAPIGDICVAGICEGGEPIDCSDEFACTVDTCDDGIDNCVHTPDDTLCDDGNDCTLDTCDVELGCVHEPDESCQAICRSPGYWATHSGSEKGAINIAQLLIDKTGPLDVCGETITSTSNALGSLSSDLEALCVKVQGVPQRQLFRQLMAAALNCRVSAIDCDTLTGGVFGDCNALCAGDSALLSVSECIPLLDCFNNGGSIAGGKCAFGACEHDTDIACGGAENTCPLYNGQSQACIPFDDSCENMPLCNEAIDFCPGDTPAGSPRACNEARSNACTIDSCD